MARSHNLNINIFFPPPTSFLLFSSFFSCNFTTTAYWPECSFLNSLLPVPIRPMPILAGEGALCSIHPTSNTKIASKIKHPKQQLKQTEKPSEDQQTLEGGWHKNLKSRLSAIWHNESYLSGLSCCQVS